MAQISVKPTRVLMIQSIKDAIKRIPAEAEQYDRDVKQFKKDMQEWCKSWDYSPSNIKHVEPVMDHLNDNKVVRASIQLKKYPANKPKFPKRPRFDGHSIRYALDELNSVLYMLELSDEERVQASVANRVVQYCRPTS